VASGRRIPESVLERDYCLAWFLIGLADSDLVPFAPGAQCLLYQTENKNILRSGETFQ
jgi:hypothetical protein